MTINALETYLPTNFKNNQSCQHNASEKAGVFYVNARSLDDLLDSFAIVHEQYVTNGFIKTREGGLFFALRDIHPSTIHTIAIDKSRVVGSLTSVFELAENLPSGASYAKELDGRIDKTTIAIEGTRFAVSDNMQKTAPIVARKLVGFVLRNWFDSGVSDVIVVVHPRHQAFWKRNCFFKVASQPKPCDRVSNSPGVLLHLNCNALKEVAVAKRSRRLDALLPKEGGVLPMSQERFSLSVEEAGLLLIFQPHVALESTERDLANIFSVYPALKEVVARLKSRAESQNSFSDKVSIRVFALRRSVTCLSKLLSRIVRSSNITMNFTLSEAVPQDFVGDFYRFAEFLIGVCEILREYRKSDSSISFKFDLKNQEFDSLVLAVEIVAKNFQIENKVLLTSIAKRFTTLKTTVVGRDEVLKKRELPLCALLGGGVFIQDTTDHSATVSFTVRGARSCSVKQQKPTIAARGREKSSFDVLNPEVNSWGLTTVLIAEPNTAEQKVWRNLLGSESFHFIVCNNGFDAKMLLYERKVDLALVSLCLPKYDGLSVVREMRKMKDGRNRFGPRTLVVGIGTESINFLESRGLLGSLDLYLQKPILRWQVYDIVNRLNEARTSGQSCMSNVKGSTEGFRMSQCGL